MKLNDLIKDQIVLNLNRLGLFNDPYTSGRVERIQSNKFYGRCPTCEDRGKYIANGEGVDCDCFFQNILFRHYLAANIGIKYHTLTTEDFISEDREIVVPVVEEYIDNLGANMRLGKGITFNGPVGTGKTMAMCIILKEALKTGIGAYFTHFDELVRTVGNSWRNEEEKWLEDKVKMVAILGIDELRTDSRNTDGFLSDVVEQIVRFRTDNNLPTLITTNLDAEREEKVFSKAYSLLSEKNIRITTAGEDVRGSIIRSRLEDVNLVNERRPIC